MPAQSTLPKTRKAPKAVTTPVSFPPDAALPSVASDEPRLVAVSAPSASDEARFVVAPVRPAAAPTIEAVAEGLLFEATLFDKSATQAGRLKAWELLGKHLGMFKDRKDEGESVLVHFDITL